MTAQPVYTDFDFAYEDAPDLHEILQGMEDEGPILPVLFHGEKAFLIRGYEELREALSDEVHFASKAFYRKSAEPSMGRNMQSLSGEAHRINRALVSRSFLPRRVMAYIEGPITEEAIRRVDALPTDQEVDLMEAFARPFPFSVIARLLGLPVEDEPLFLTWALKIIDWPWDPDGAIRARDQFTDYLKPLLAQRRVDPADDVLSIMATAEVEGMRLEDEEVFSLCRLLFPAGSDTAYKNLGSLLTAILEQPGMRKWALGTDQERDDLVQESLRWEPPVALLPRACSQSTEFHGTRVEAETPMLFGLAAANRDPRVFDRPQQFDPERSNNGQHLSFGHGVHFCLGSHLARRELETGIRILFERYPDMQLSCEAKIPIQGCVLRGPKEIPVRLVP
ncbi:MAG: cytochrome P450 [Myxococcota bacterium]|nr:cytochrome P450 [Myxococcota bacterium]